MNDTLNLPVSADPVPNWSAAERFETLIQAVRACKTAGHENLIRTGFMIQEWRGEHREDIDKYLAVCGKDVGDEPGAEILLIVQVVYAGENKSTHTSHASALRQALSGGRTADDLTTYFREKTPTDAAKEWRAANPHTSGNKVTRVDVPIEGLVLPEGHKPAYSACEKLTCRCIALPPGPPSADSTRCKPRSRAFFQCFPGGLLGWTLRHMTLEHPTAILSANDICTNFHTGCRNNIPGAHEICGVHGHSVAPFRLMDRSYRCTRQHSKMIDP